MAGRSSNSSLSFVRKGFYLMQDKRAPITSLLTDQASMERLTAEPLYKRAESAMVARIVERVWSPGQRLPNEFELAAEFGVSQGTIRKALVSLERRGLLARSPGRGTTVVKTTAEESLFAFFRLRDDATGLMTVPEPLSERISRRPATRKERDLFETAEMEVYVLERVRQHGGVPFALERMRLPVTLFKGIEKDTPLPNSLYPYLQERFGLSVMMAEEALSAVLGKAKETRKLGVPAGTPLLRVERRARDLARRIVELRTSHFLTDGASYRVDLARSEPLSAVTERD
jgi:GntR family transcriptional regulator